MSTRRYFEAAATATRCHSRARRGFPNSLKLAERTSIWARGSLTSGCDSSSLGKTSQPWPAPAGFFLPRLSGSQRQFTVVSHSGSRHGLRGRERP
ncbi:hypothetical protein AM571_CH01654 [Rhizobium etli 8C-3]|uniref:Uncharacterized protein n=1 Tax=Rhizobium etli 8C-3 TaxID=538025 RepID=A0A1L5P2X5_RHIET|nr:hypothetical protein AM571_CH01654 [Rhizobium etli 8C-3]